MKEETLMKKAELVTLIVGGIYLALGGVLLVFPNESSRIFGYVIGSAAILFGVYRLVLYFLRNRAAQLLAVDLYTGIMLLTAGGFCIAKHEDLLQYLSVFFGVLLIAGSIIKFQNAFDLKKLGMERWWIVAILSGISVLFAILVIVKPPFLQQIQLLATGIFLLYDGLSGLAVVVLFELTRRKSGAHEAKKQQQMEPEAAAETEYEVQESANETAEAEEPEEHFRFDPNTGEMLK